MTAQYLFKQMDMETGNRYHLQAARYFAEIVNEEGKKSVKHLVEARWHYLQAGEWNRAAEITFALEQYLTLHGFPQRSMELLQELEDKALDDKNRSIVFHLIGILHQAFGDYEAALTQYRKSLEIKERIGDIKGIALSMGQMGNLHFQKQEFETALKLLIQAFQVFTKLGSPNAHKAKNNITEAEKKLPKKKFKEILKEFGLEVNDFKE